MARTFKINITGSGSDTDAPSVEDLLEHLRDYFEILKGVEEALSEDGKLSIDWRIINASKNSPLSLEAAAYPRIFATNIDAEAEKILSNTAHGLHILQSHSARPAFFSEKTLARVERFFERITNGLSSTIIDCGPSLPSLELSKSSARLAAQHVASVLKPQPKAYKELGSVEGIAHGVDKDGWGNPVLKFRLRTTGDELTCRLSGEAFAIIAARQIGDVLRTCRIQLYGTIHYKALGQISRIDAFQARILRDASELPSIDDISDDQFTGGLRTEAFIERIRRGESN